MRGRVWHSSPMLTKISTYDAPFSFDETGQPDPILVLATPATSESVKWNFKPGREWYWIDHQAAGVGCRHPEFVVTILDIRPEALEKLRDLDAEYCGSDLGVFGVPLSAYIKYQEYLAAIDPALTCETSYGDLIEAVYPIDYTAGAVAALTTEELPADLNTLVKWDNPLDEFLGCVNRWRLLLLGQNSD